MRSAHTPGCDGRHPGGLGGRADRLQGGRITSLHAPTALQPPLASATGDALTALARRGRDDAFAELHRRHRPELVRFARRMLRDSGHDPEDVVQDAFLSAYRALRAIDCPVAVRPWLFMIVRNRALDVLRAPQAPRAPDGDRILALVPAPAGEPDAAAIRREEVREIVEAICRLPARQRLALVRRELEGRPLDELADELDTTIPAAKSLIFRARAAVTDVTGCAPRSAAGRSA